MISRYFCVLPIAAPPPGRWVDGTSPVKARPAPAKSRRRRFVSRSASGANGTAIAFQTPVTCPAFQAISSRCLPDRVAALFARRVRCIARHGATNNLCFTLARFIVKLSLPLRLQRKNLARQPHDCRAGRRSSLPGGQTSPRTSRSASPVAEAAPRRQGAP